MTDLVLLILALGVGGALLAAAVYYARAEPPDIPDWDEETYRPRSNEPRAVTRIKSKDIQWEIQP